jgi:ABC-type multidrug transport system fused ATPase/permease subunit
LALQVFSQLVNIFAQVEVNVYCYGSGGGNADMSSMSFTQQEMNNVERVTYYGNLPQEAPATKPNDPPPDWPQRGHLQFNNVQFRYREGLPLVLKGVTFEVMPGEKVGARFSLYRSSNTG